MSLFLILLAGGDSKRLKSNTPKPFQIINNKKLLEHTLYAFKDINKIKKTVIVYNKKHKKELDKLNLKNCLLVKGGYNRQESTFNALNKIKNMNCNKVLIHDVARPIPPKKMIDKIILKLKKNHAVVPVIKITDATKRIKNKLIFKNIERNTLRLSQTPQGFTFNKLYKKHLNNFNKEIDDDSSLFTNGKDKIITVSGSKNNLKITDIEDLKLFQSISKSKIYYGIGFDIHRLVPKKKLYLGGIKVKSSIGTLGHSDGDPVLHAIIDSILGACRLGDIGKIFSNKYKRYKNIRSTILLRKIVKNIKLKNFSINNIDINIITQKPKIKKYSRKMTEQISKLCEIEQSQVNIKGKTTEKLGLIGKERAIASEVITSVIKYNE